MKDTFFLGVAAVLDAIGAFLISTGHRYTAYGCLVGAVAMVILAVIVAYRIGYRLKRGKEELGHILIELSACELAAYNGNDGTDYDRLMVRISKLKERMKNVGRKYLDSSIESRFLAVNVLDVHVDKATEMHFVSRAQGTFWAAYQQIKGWRNCVERLLQELPR